ncbi:MAG: tetratricopeptide repeat protein [Gemmatimonadota bacterium]
MRRILALALLVPAPALAQGTAAVASDSNDPVAHYATALRHWERRDWDAAERALREAVTLAPDYADASLGLALLFGERGEKHWQGVERTAGPAAVARAREEARLAYRRAFLADPLVDLALYLRSEGPDLDPAEAPWWFADFRGAVRTYARGDGGAALEALRRVVTDLRAGGDAGRLPDEVLWFRALVAAREREFGVAIAELARLTARADSTEGLGEDRAAPLRANDYRYVLATVHYQAGHFDAAIATFEAAIARDLSLYQAHTQLARIHQAAGRWEEALRERHRAIAANPDDPNLVAELGATLLEAGRASDAGPVLAEASRRAPRDPRVPYLQALAALQADDSAAARAAFSRFLAIAPSRYDRQIADARRRLAALP